MRYLVRAVTHQAEDEVLAAYLLARLLHVALARQPTARAPRLDALHLARQLHALLVAQRLEFCKHDTAHAHSTKRCMHTAQ